MELEQRKESKTPDSLFPNSLCPWLLEFGDIDTQCEDIFTRSVPEFARTQ